jgi:molecular chaperone GrpE
VTRRASPRARRIPATRASAWRQSSARPQAVRIPATDDHGEGDREPEAPESAPAPAAPDGAQATDDADRDDPLARALRERDEYLDLARRTQADFENYRKRAAKEAAAAGDRAKGGLVRELLPVVDNLERALSSAEEGEQQLAEGVRLVHSELVAVLERNGVEQFDPSGERFDPAEHEALSTREGEGAEPGVVLDVMEKGYRSNGTVLRPARVVVSG